MKLFLNIVFCLSFWTGFSQVTYEKMPENAQEIHFVYKKETNYVINDEGIFADTLLLKIDFPDLKYSLRKHPSNSTFTCGFSRLKEFGRDNKSKLKSIIYHTNETINATHFILSKMTIFKVVRGDEETKMIFKKYFGERFINFEYRQEFDFSKRIEKRKYPRVDYTLSFDEIAEKIDFKTDDTFGFYSETINNILYKNVVYFNKDLPKYVSPLVFKNNIEGVEKIETIGRTITLKSVYYK